MRDRPERHPTGADDERRCDMTRTRTVRIMVIQQTAAIDVDGRFRPRGTLVGGRLRTKTILRQRFPQPERARPAPPGAGAGLIDLGWTKLACQAVFGISFYDLLTSRAAVHRRTGEPLTARRQSPLNRRA